jgi:hypothetical protein
MTADDAFTIVQPQNTLCLSQFRFELFRRSHISANISFRGYPSTGVFHGDRAEPSRARIRSGAYSFRRNLFYLYLSTTNAPSQVNQQTTVRHICHLMTNQCRKQYGATPPKIRDLYKREWVRFLSVTVPLKKFKA